MHTFKNALAALTVLAIYLTVSTKAQSYSYKSSAPLCSAKDLSVFSCSPESAVTDSCCVEDPGGLLLQTQLYNPNLGPADTWTIHGLWGDFCNGSYPASCDPARAYQDVPKILREYREFELIDTMTELWLNDPPVTTENGTDADLWAHEWSKHGTCMSTLRPSCYRHYTRARELVDFYKAAVRLYRSLPTFQFLKFCGIVPSSDQTYALNDVQRCLTQATGGFVPHLGCNTEGEFNEVWYYFHWMGMIRDGEVAGTNSTSGSTCPPTGIKYLPKIGE